MKVNARMLFVLLFVVAAIPVVGLISAWAMSKMWLWFLSGQYGSGPSIGAWYGVFAIYSFLNMSSNSSGKSGDNRSGESSESSVITGILMSQITYFTFLAVAFGVGSVFGWVR
jgi:hypothetical protein